MYVSGRVGSIINTLKIRLSCECRDISIPLTFHSSILLVPFLCWKLTLCSPMRGLANGGEHGEYAQTQ